MSTTQVPHTAYVTQLAHVAVYRLETLPLETLDEIASYLRRPDLTSAICLLPLHASARRLLWRHVALNYRTLAHMHATVCGHGPRRLHYADVIRTLKFCGTSWWEGEWPPAQLDFSVRSRTAWLLASLLAEIKNADSLTLAVPYSMTAWIRYWFQEKDVFLSGPSIWDVASLKMHDEPTSSPAILSRLTKLKISNISLMPLLFHRRAISQLTISSYQNRDQLRRLFHYVQPTIHELSLVVTNDVHLDTLFLSVYLGCPNIERISIEQTGMDPEVSNLRPSPPRIFTSSVVDCATGSRQVVTGANQSSGGVTKPHRHRQSFHIRGRGRNNDGIDGMRTPSSSFR